MQLKERKNKIINDKIINDKSLLKINGLSKSFSNIIWLIVKVIITVVLLLIILCSNVYTVYADENKFDEENINDDLGLSQEIMNEYTDFYGDLLNDGLKNGVTSIEENIKFPNIRSLEYNESESNVFSVLSSEFNVDSFNLKNLMTDLNSGKFSVEPKSIINALIKLLLKEVYNVAGILVSVLVISILASYLGGLKEGFASSAVSECAFFICYIVTAGMCASAFYTAADCSIGGIRGAAVFMKTVVPVMLGAYISCGAAVTAAAMEPTLLMIIEVTLWITEAVFVPAVMISTALNIVNGMSDKFKTDKLVKLLNNGVKWGFSAVLMIFVSLSGLKSVASAGANGLAVKLGKFAASNFIPVVGGILSESLETVVNCGVLIKNTAGIIGIICVVLIAVGPVLKLAAMLLMFRITAAVAEPISDGKIVACLSRMGDSVAVLFSITAAVAVMFVIVITILINAGNTAVFMGR